MVPLRLSAIVCLVAVALFARVVSACDCPPRISAEDDEESFGGDVWFDIYSTSNVRTSCGPYKEYRRDTLLFCLNSNEDNVVIRSVPDSGVINGATGFEPVIPPVKFFRQSTGGPLVHIRLGNTNENRDLPKRVPATIDVQEPKYTRGFRYFNAAMGSGADNHLEPNGAVLYGAVNGGIAHLTAQDVSTGAYGVYVD